MVGIYGKRQITMKVGQKQNGGHWNLMGSVPTSSFAGLPAIR
jgi:hypothetical protein